MQAARLEVLTRQLVSSSLSDANQIARDETHGEEARPPPGGGKGTLSVVDNRTGKKYTVREVAVVTWLVGINSKSVTTSTKPTSQLRLSAGDLRGRHSKRSGAEANQGRGGWRGSAHL